MASLARLLSPEEYGLFGMVFAFTALMLVFQDLGLTLATVQKVDLTWTQLSTVFWANLAFGVVISGVTAAAAPVIAWFFGEPRLVGVTLWIATGFVLTSLGGQHLALIVRRMQFMSLAACDLASLATGGAVGIWMAWRGFGVYALVGQALVLAGTRTIVAWMLAGWVPGLPVRGSGVRGMFQFGGYVTGFNVLNYFVRNLDKVLLGRFWGPVETGLYTRAYALMTFPMTVVTGPMSRVMISALSRLQDAPERYARAHLRAMRLLGLISFPLGGGLVVMAEEAIAIVFGEMWMETVPVFRVLCISGIFQGWASSMGWLYLSAGKTRNMFLRGTIVTPIIVIALLPTIWYGPMGAAVGYVSATLLILVPSVWYAAWSVGIPFLPIMRTSLGPLAATGVMCACVCLLRAFLPSDISLTERTVALVLGGMVSYSLAAGVVARQAVREAVRLVRYRTGNQS